MKKLILLMLACGIAFADLPPVSDTLQIGAVANANGRTLPVQGYNSVAFTVNCASCSGGTQVNFEGSQDGKNFVSLTASNAAGGTASSTTTAGVTVWSVSVSGYISFRTRVSAYSAGTVTVSATAVSGITLGPGGAVPMNADGSVNVSNRVTATKLYGSPAGASPQGALVIASPTTGFVFDIGIDAAASNPPPGHGLSAWLQPRNASSAAYYDLALVPVGGYLCVGCEAPSSPVTIVGSTVPGTPGGASEVVSISGALKNGTAGQSANMFVSWSTTSGDGQTSILQQVNGVVSTVYHYNGTTIPIVQSFEGGVVFVDGSSSVIAKSYGYEAGFPSVTNSGSVGTAAAYHVRGSGTGGSLTGITTPYAFWSESLAPSVFSGSAGVTGTTSHGAIQITGTAVSSGIALDLGVNSTDANSWIQSRNSGSAAYYPLLLNPLGGRVAIGTSVPYLAFHAVGTDAMESGSSTPNGSAMFGGPTSIALTMGVSSGSLATWIQSRNMNSATWYPLSLNPSGGAVQILGIKSTTGTRYVCVDTSGNLTSSASACSGT